MHSIEFSIVPNKRQDYGEAWHSPRFITVCFFRFEIYNTLDYG